MNRLFYAIVLSIFLIPNVAKTQIGVNFGSGSANPGQTVDIDVTVDDFNNIVLMQYSVNWDSTEFIFNDILNVTTTLPEFTEAGNIGDPSAPAVDEGQLTVSWNLISTEPESLPDGHRLFTLRLEAVGDPCGETTIVTSDDPRNIEVIDEDFNDIGLINMPGMASIPGNDCNGMEECGFGDPDGVGIIGEELNADNGTNVCLSVSVENFINIESAQSGIIWDPAVAQYTGVGNFGLPGLSESLFNDNNVANGELRFLWFDNTGETPQTLPDGAVIFDVCFDVVGDMGTSTFVEFVDLPNFDIEFSSGGNVQPYFTDCGRITVGDDPVSDNFTLIADMDSIMLGENGCVEFSVRNFDNIQSMQFNVMYDPAVVTFTGADCFDNLPFLDQSNFNLTEPGKVRFSWNTLGDGITLADNTIIFKLCFDAIGACDEITDLMFVDDPPVNIEISDADNNVVSPVDLVTGSITVACPEGIFITLVNINPPDCAGEASGGITVTVSGGDGNYTCTWYNGNGGTYDPNSNPAQGPTQGNCNAFGQVAGEYCLEVEDGEGTTGSACFIIEDPDPLVVSGVVTHEVNGGDGAILLDIDGAQGNTNIVWSGGLSGSNPMGLSKGTYNVTVTDEMGCSDTESFDVNPPALGVANAVVENSDCEGSGSIDITVTGGCSPYNFLWQRTGGGGQATFEDIFGIQDGEWCVTITDSDNPPNQIVQCYIVALDVPPISIVDADVDDADCNDEASGSINLSVTGGCAPLSYNWEGPSDPADEEDIDNLLAGEYCVTITDSFDPPNTFIQCFDVDEPNPIFINEDNIVPSNGSNGSILVSTGGGTGDLSFDWSNDGTGDYDDSEDLANLAPGNYTLCARDENDCEKCVDFVVKWSEVIPDLDDPGQYNGFGVSCAGECDGVISGIINGNEPIAVTLDGSPTSFPITNLCAGSYTVAFTDAEGLTASAVVEITEPPALSIVQDSSLISCSNGSDGVAAVSVEGGVGAYEFEWNVPGAGPVLTDLAPGIYAVVVTDDNNCQVMLQNIEVDDCIDAPCYDSRTVMTPNGDGLNDDLFINCADDNPSTLEVYDRWGKRVYVQNNYDNTWTGVNLAGNPLVEGAYMWVLRVNFDSGERQVHKGTITILRDQF